MTDAPRIGPLIVTHALKAATVYVALVLVGSVSVTAYCLRRGWPRAHRVTRLALDVPF